MPSRVNKLPRHIPMNQDIRERAREYQIVQLLGKDYYIPITAQAQKLFKLKDGRINNDILLEHWLRDILHGIYLQVRDTVGTEIQGTLSSELKEGLERLFSRQLQETIQKSLREQLPELKKIRVNKENVQPQWLKTAFTGVSGAYKIQLIVESKNFAIVKFPGGSYWSGMSGTRYSPTHFVLVRKDNLDYWHGFHKEIHEGRATLEVKKKFEEILTDAEAGKYNKEDD